MPFRSSSSSSSATPSTPPTSTGSSFVSGLRRLPGKGMPTTATSAKARLQAVLDSASIRSSASRSSSSSSVSTREVIGGDHFSVFSRSSDDADYDAESDTSAGSLPERDVHKLTPIRHFDADPTWIPDPTDRHSLRHAEFGWCDSQNYRYESRWNGSSLKSCDEEPAYMTYIATYISYLILIVIGHIRDFIGKRTHKKFYRSLMEQNGYAALNSDFDSFYTRRLKTRIEDIFSRPVTGVAGRTITLMDRKTDDYGLSFRFLGTTTQAFNISSYNYLGFAQSRGGVTDTVEDTVRQVGLSTLGHRWEAGSTDLHVQCERIVARFIGVEDAMVISQGFATNSTTLPALVSKGCLIISDELNHSSIRFGARLSGAMVRQYKHNDVADLENLLREVISQGQPRTHRPWRKILLVVEGLYSMEGTLLDLPGICALREKYKFFLYIDEAHSIGAIGPNGRGVCDYFGIDPRSVDIMMGTFTKSFGSAGGYISGKRELIQALRARNHSSVYGESISPPVLQQIIASMASIMGPQALEVLPSLATMAPRLRDGSEGRERLRRLAFNARFLSTGLRKLGFLCNGHQDSPVIPMLIFNPGKLNLFSQLMLTRYNIVVVVVAYPATPLVSGRARFCVSAAHTVADLCRVLRAIDDVGGTLGLRHGKRSVASVDELESRAVEIVHGAVPV